MCLNVQSGSDRKIKSFKKVLEEIGHWQSDGQLGGIWQAPVLRRSVKQLDGDLKGILSSVEENSEPGVQTPVMGWRISNAEMGAQNPTGQSVSPGWIPGVAWHGLDQCRDQKHREVGSGKT